MAVRGLPFWLDLPRPEFARLEGDLLVDVAVIGAGIAGLKLAHSLAGHGLQVAVLEGDRVGVGASGRNQGSINHSAAMGYGAAIEAYGRQRAQQLWQLGLENHRLVRHQIEAYEIDCDYQQEGMGSLARRDVSGWEETLEQYRAEYELLQQDGFDVELLDEIQAAEVGGNGLYAGALYYRGDGQFHSGKFVLGLAQGIDRLAQVQIYEGVRVARIAADGQGVQLAAPAGTIRAERVLLSTNALVPQFVPHLERALRAERGQVLVTEPLAERPCRGCFGTAMAWWREILEADGRFRLLFGGGRARDEPDSLFPQFAGEGRPHPLLESEGFSPSEAHQGRLEEQLAILFPRWARAKITHRWGGLQSFTADNLPEIGCFDPERRIWGMAGFCGRGNCHANVGAEYLAAKAAGVKSQVEGEFGGLFEDLMGVGRDRADWGSWRSLYEKEQEG